MNIAQLRRRFRRHGYRIWTPRARHAAEYGPYALVDLDTSGIGPYGLDLEDLNALLADWDRAA